jgi:PAS domain-containing protein
LLILDHELRVKLANQAFYRMFQVEPDQVTGMTIDEVGEGRWDVPKLRDVLTEIVPAPGGMRTWISRYRLAAPATAFRSVSAALSSATHTYRCLCSD